MWADLILTLLYPKPKMPSITLAFQRGALLAVFTWQGSQPTAVFKANREHQCVRVCVCVREKIHSSCWSDWAQLLTSGLRQRTSWHTSISPLQALLWFCIHVLQSVWSKASNYLQKRKSGDQFPCTPHETAWFANWCHELLKKAAHPGTWLF